MKKSNRLIKNDHILFVLKKNKKIFSNVANLFFYKNDLNSWRVAIIASKKQFKQAVLRNKIKRQLKAIIRELNEDLNSYDIVFILKQEWLNNRFEQNKKAISMLIKKLKGAK